MLRASPRSTLFPYATLFRSELVLHALVTLLVEARPLVRAWPHRRAVRRVEQSPRAQPVAERIALLGEDLLDARELRSEEHTSELQSREKHICLLLPENNKH